MISIWGTIIIGLLCVEVGYIIGALVALHILEKDDR